MDLAHAGRILLTVGLATAALGAVLWTASKALPGFRLGRLPGDIVMNQGGFKLYVPLTTMLIASVLLALVLWLVGVLRR